MNKNHPDILSSILDYSEKPQLFELGETHFWDDPHISKSMLEAHLNPDTDAASRKPVTIGRTIDHLVSANVLKKGDKVLDLGCGPGLYSSKLYEKGMKVTGVDISKRSIDFAMTESKPIHIVRRDCWKSKEVNLMKKLLEC